MKRFMCCVLVCFIFYTGYLALCNAADTPTVAPPSVETVTSTTSEALTVTAKYCDTLVSSVTQRGGNAGIVQVRNQRALRRITTRGKNPDEVAQLTELNKKAVALSTKSWATYMEAGILAQLANLQAARVKDLTDDAACVVRANCISNYCQAVVLLKKTEALVAEWEEVNTEMTTIIKSIKDADCDDRVT